MAWRWANAWEFYGHLTSSIHPFIFPLLQHWQHIISHLQDLLLVKPWAWADIHVCCPFFYSHMWVSYPVGGDGITHGVHDLVVFTIDAVAATFASWIFYQEGGERDNIAVAFWYLYFTRLSCGYWCAQELEHICIGIWLLGWWQAGRYFHWVMGLKCGVYKYTCHPIIPPCTCFWKHLTWLCPFRYLHEKPYAQVSAKLCTS